MLIFITLMMPVEVRIVPTFQVAANLNFIDSYLGLVRRSSLGDGDLPVPPDVHDHPGGTA